MPRRKSKGGRPTLLDMPVEVESFDAQGRRFVQTVPASKAILDAVATGVPQEAAAEAVGIHRATLYRWKEQGAEKPKSKYGAFATGLKVAKAKAHQRLAKAYYIHAMKNPSAAQFWFSRREAKAWAEPTQRVQMTNRGPPPEEMDALADSLMEKLRRMANGALPQNGVVNGHANGHAPNRPVRTPPTEA